MKRWKFAIALTFIIFFITALVSTAGFLAVGMLTKDQVPPNITAGEIEIGRLSRQDAVQKIKEYYGSIFKNDYININYNIGSIGKIFRIKYSDIELSIDAEETVNHAISQKGTSAFERILNGYFTSRVVKAPIKIDFNNNKLKESLKPLASLIEKEPKNANVYLLDGKLRKDTSEDGIILNLENSVEKIRRSISEKTNQPIVFDYKNNYEINVINPEFSQDKLKDIEDVIATYSTEIKGSENEKYIKIASKAINKVWLNGTVSSGRPVEFSFNNYLSKENGIMEENNEGYNQVASTLFAALLLTDIDRTSITRVSHESSVDYIDPGLDVIVFGDTIDFKFINSIESPIMIFSSVKNNKVTVSIAGKKRDKSVVNNLKIDIESKYPQAVINVEDDSLGPGDKKVISNGKEGVLVKVSLETQKEGVVINKKELYTQKYKPSDSIVQIGRAYDNDNNNAK
ncbi:MAG TPA: VanW family protein [Pseudobacteroides sp.]|uniref:VanW family protein n=1 Tax=Pseudobacteroides sp. TaxID=1968840 RepID=UPI002F92D968